MANLIPSKQIEQDNIVTGSVLITENLFVEQNAFISGSSFFGQLSTDIHLFTGSVSIDGPLVVNGDLTASGDSIFFTRVGTNEPNDSVMVIGNYYDDYIYRQTTVFQNGNVIVSGSIEIAEDGYLILAPQSIPPPIPSGGLYYSTDGYYYLAVHI
jgi:hypothetical protein